ncbi:hypothetical protein [Phreatobacter sp.]|uniref:hypothetical protein n=1 Tax=Phreatobacter sp. TaxID=1966341 RepID=UPI003F70F3BD
MKHIAVAGLAAILLAAGGSAVRAEPSVLDETRDRVLIIHQSRGTLAPGTRPRCFPPSVDETVARSQYQCPFDAPSGRPPYPTARSLWGIFGNH